ncbi:MAG: hypothetical protein HY097_08505 [Nitrospinae bacterium]|nr:hypothetical protein [Nitrospinota bacterium]MBI3813855.1 hypothetical protein [Nitrospinota bacterium]
MLEQRRTDRRKTGNRRLRIDQSYKEQGKEKRIHQARRKDERRKKPSASVTCRECGTLFLVTREIFYQATREGKPILCPNGCKKDNTKIAKTAVFMIERGKR